MSLIRDLIARAHLRVGLPVPGAGDWQPDDAALREALALLGEEDDAAAVLAFRNRPADVNARQARIVEETIMLGIEAQMNRLEDQINGERKILKVAEGQITVLTLRLERRREVEPLRFARLTIITGTAIIATTLVAIVWFDLPVWIGLLGLTLYATAAWLLIRVDREQRDRAHRDKHSIQRAEVAEEINILKADMRGRARHVVELEYQREQLEELAEQLSAPIEFD